MKPEIGIADKDRKSVSKELAILLADEYVLYTKTRNAHWNVEGADFFEKHKFFESQFEQLDEIIDSVAERIRTLGHYTSSSLKSFLQLTHFSEDAPSKNDSLSHIKVLLMDHESIIIHCRENIHQIAIEYKDFGTSDFVTGLMEAHEKMAFFLRSHLK
jgi:starvation-inducible DNA-binding protein